MSIESLENKRNELIYQLWVTLRELEQLKEPEDFTKEDAIIWGNLTCHSAVLKAR